MTHQMNFENPLPTTIPNVVRNIRALSPKNNNNDDDDDEEIDVTD